MVYENTSINWDQLVRELFPSVIIKFGMSPKQLNGKKLWEKLKDIKLSELGLTESMVDQLAQTLVNNYGTSSVNSNPLGTSTPTRKEVSEAFENNNNYCNMNDSICFHQI